MRYEKSYFLLTRKNQGVNSLTTYTNALTYSPVSLPSQFCSLLAGSKSSLMCNTLTCHLTDVKHDTDWEILQWFLIDKIRSNTRLWAPDATRDNDFQTVVAEEE